MIWIFSNFPIFVYFERDFKTPVGLRPQVRSLLFWNYTTDPYLRTQDVIYRPIAREDILFETKY
jgi:hypothetical protein